MTQAEAQERKGFLFDVRVLELADEKGEFCGKLLAGAGAGVIKIEPPQGSRTRRIGPFYQDKEDPERSLHFWHYNHGKRGITLDYAAADGKEILRKLAAKADVLIETHPPGYMESLGLGYANLAAINPRLIMVSISPFGQTGPRRAWRGSDLVHLALGGEMMNCGYDPTPEGEYDTPPIAPQMWHSSHITCAQTKIAILGALLYREQSGLGQYIDAPMHQAVSTNTEMDVTAFTYNRTPYLRQTGRHASPRVGTNVNYPTKDGRYVHCGPGLGNPPEKLVEMLAKHGAAKGLEDPKYKDPKNRGNQEIAYAINARVRDWIGSYKFERDLWKEGQAFDYHWAAVRKPEENAYDPHWRERKTFTDVHHEDIDRTLTYVGAPWLAEECPWRVGPRAPHLGEHNAEVLGEELGLTGGQLAVLQKSKVI